MTPVDGLPWPARGHAMAVLLLGLALTVLDATLINVALPSIAADLGASPSQAVMVINAYQIAVVSLLLPLATLGDRVGYRRIYRIGLALFTVASVGCVLATSLDQLVAARALQGFGAAGVMSVASAQVRMIFPERRLARGLALVSMTVAATATAGPTVAAAILLVGPWQWLFLINVPIGLVALAGAMRALPASLKSDAPFDLPSALLSVLTFGLLFTGIDLIGHRKFQLSTALIIGAGLLIAVVFVRRQNRLALPLLPVDLLRIPLFALSIATSICSFSAQTIAFVSLPFLLQHGLGRTPVETGLLMTPWPLALMFSVPVAARLIGRYPAGMLGCIGLGGVALGLLALATLPADPHTFDIVWRVALCGLGFGFFQAPNNHTILTSAPPRRSGGASGMLGTARLTGQTIGATIAALGMGLLAGPGQTVMWIGAAIATLGALLSIARLRVPRPAA